MLNESNWYQVPTQVIFIPEGEAPCVGIAYRDEVICSCCGGVYELSECKIVHEYEWITLHDAIVGDDEEYDKIYDEFYANDEEENE